MNSKGKEGIVYLTGAGPGAVDHLTIGARNVLETCDIVLHDRLTGPEILELITGNTPVIDVGKRKRDHREWRIQQNTINHLLAREAGKGKTVVRLKNGDPFIFGRGGEELEYLQNRDIPCRILPGISSVVSAAAEAGIPLTHRADNSGFTVVTGHEKPGKKRKNVDWGDLARQVQNGRTLVILMGVSGLEENIHALLDHGVPPETPAGAIERSSYEDQVILLSPLESLREDCRKNDVSAPAVFVIGRVVGRSPRWNHISS